MMQNFCAAGETIGGAIYLLESSPKEQHDFLSGVYGASTIAGIILASIATSLLVYFNAVEIGWRYLYFIGVATALIGIIIRRDTLTVGQVPKIKKTTVHQHLQVLFLYKKSLFLIAIVSGFSYVTYCVSIILLNGCLPLIADDP
jgi:MFS family permease